MREVLLHAHIFKNAGTTLDWSLARSFGDAFVDHRNDTQMRLRPAAVLAEALADERTASLSSHALPCPAPALEGVSFTTLLMLRHPLRRARSVFAFERRQRADTPGARAAKAMDFKQYLRWRMRDEVAPTIRNFQTRYLSGQLRRPPQYTETADDFAAALAFLRTLPAVGVVERYLESMVAFEASYGDRFPQLDLTYEPQNMSRPSLAEESLDWIDDLGDLRDELIDRNSYDLALYRAANDLLDQVLGRLDSAERATVAFRDRQASVRQRLCAGG